MLVQAGPWITFGNTYWKFINGPGAAGFVSLNWEYRHTRGFLLRLGMTAFFGEEYANEGGWWLLPGLVLGGSF